MRLRTSGGGLVEAVSWAMLADGNLWDGPVLKNEPGGFLRWVWKMVCRGKEQAVLFRASAWRLFFDGAKVPNKAGG